MPAEASRHICSRCLTESSYPDFLRNCSRAPPKGRNTWIIVTIDTKAHSEEDLSHYITRDAVNTVFITFWVYLLFYSAPIFCRQFFLISWSSLFFMSLIFEIWFISQTLVCMNIKFMKLTRYKLHDYHNGLFLGCDADELDNIRMIILLQDFALL